MHEHYFSRCRAVVADWDDNTVVCKYPRCGDHSPSGNNRIQNTGTLVRSVHIMVDFFIAAFMAWALGAVCYAAGYASGKSEQAGRDSFWRKL